MTTTCHLTVQQTLIAAKCVAALGSKVTELRTSLRRRTTNGDTCGMPDQDYVQKLIQAAGAGRLAVADLLWAVSGSELVVPLTRASASAQAPEELVPLTLSSRSARFVAAFTSRDVLSKSPWSDHPLTSLPGYTLLSRLPHDVGAVFNPGTPFGFELPAAGAAQFQEQLKRVELNN